LHFADAGNKFHDVGRILKRFQTVDGAPIALVVQAGIQAGLDGKDLPPQGFAVLQLENRFLPFADLPAIAGRMMKDAFNVFSVADPAFFIRRGTAVKTAFMTAPMPRS
jgi:hypothetical protein